MSSMLKAAAFSAVPDTPRSYAAGETAAQSLLRSEDREFAKIMML